MSASHAAITWESIGEDPSVRDLAERMALHSSKFVPAERFVFQFGEMARDISLPAVLAVARQTFKEHDLEFSVVKNRVRNYANKHTPRWAFCTGGMTALEISPNGFYGRCTKTGLAQIYMGDLRAEEPIKVLDRASDDLSCDIKCQQLMCFTNNVVRATDQADFAGQIDRQGLRGFYKPNHKGYNSKIFIRWKMTDVCNYTCAYCTDWQTVNKRGAELTDAETLAGAKKIASQFDSISLRLTGGEPSARRCYVDLMRIFHDNLDRFTDIEIRTNLSYQAKHKEVLSWGWNGKLHLHIGCHIRDKNFMPWRTVELFRDAPDADYVLKFVSTPTIRHHVMFFRQYFIENGIPSRNVRIIEEVFRKEEKATELEEAPPARKTLEQRTNPARGAGVEQTDTATVPKAPNGGAATNGSVRRFTLTELRAMTREKTDVLADEPDGGDCCGKAERAATIAA